MGSVSGFTSAHPPTAACNALGRLHLPARRLTRVQKSLPVALAGSSGMATPPAAATAAAAAAVEERPQQPPSGQQPAQQQERRVVQLQAVDITAENFAPFGQVRSAKNLHVGWFAVGFWGCASLLPSSTAAPCCIA